MTKQTVDHLIEYRKKLMQFINTGLFEVIFDGGDFGYQKVFELHPNKKRAIQIEILNVEAYLAGYVNLRSKDVSGVYTKKYHALKD
jgi:hypothetical protein